MRKTPKEQLESWHKDKAVQDNIVESWLCVDCGVNTAPGVPAGPTTRIDIALNDESEMRVGHESEIYHVEDAIWKQAGMRPWNGCLCIGCIERRLGRQLRPRDFARHDKEVWAQFPCTERLLNRRGFATVRIKTPDGPCEMICALEHAPLIDGAYAEEAA
jgi:hypothetical protein